MDHAGVLDILYLSILYGVELIALEWQTPCVVVEQLVAFDAACKLLF